MKISTLIILCVLVLLFVGGGFFYYVKYSGTIKEKKTSTSGEVRERRIVAFGDSLTIGYGVPLPDSYPSQLQKKLTENGYNYKVINLGVSGETTADGLARLPSVFSYEPDIVLLEFGANDFLQSLSPETAQKNLDDIILAFDKKNIKVILVNVEQNPIIPLPNKDRFAQIMPDLAKKYGIPIISSFLNGVLLNSSLTLEDRLHPNKNGYTKILEDNVWPTLRNEISK